MITIISCWFFTIAVIGFGLNYFFKNNFCNLTKAEIYSLAEIQDQWLYSYGYFSALNLEKEKLKTLSEMIDIRESHVKRHIEFFSQKCKSKLNKVQLVTILEGFNHYLSAKNVLFGESQDTMWIRKMMPLQDDF